MFLFGGAKPDDLLELLEQALPTKKVDTVLLSGVIGELALLCSGFDLGKKLEVLKSKGYLEAKSRVQALLDKYPKALIIPQDVAVVINGKRVEVVLEKGKKSEILMKNVCQDVGSKTITLFSKILSQAGSVYFKGPAGNFEVKGFEKGTKGILSAINKNKTFAFMGGGHSVTAAEEFGALKNFSYVSLAGGAVVHFLSGKKLPGAVVLEESFIRGLPRDLSFVVVGSNTLDITVDLPEKFSQVLLGGKVKINNNFETFVGGGGMNVSVGLSRLGAKVGYVGKISQENEAKLVSKAKREKFDLFHSHISSEPCAKSIILDTKDSDRVIFTYRGQNSLLTIGDCDLSKIKKVKNFYFTALDGKAFLTQILLAKGIKRTEKGILICYNPSEYLIKSEKKIFELVKLSDVLVLNYEEAQLLSGKKKLIDCLQELKKYVSKVVVITDGSRGAYAYDGSVEFSIKAYHPSQVIDTTGAGDAFAGTFFFFYVKGVGIQKALEYAAKNSASECTIKGVQNGLLTYKQVIDDNFKP